MANEMYSAEHDPANEPIMQFFKYDHLPAPLREVSRPFHDMAVDVIQDLPRNFERSECLRKLLEGKDCAVRAMVFKP